METNPKRRRFVVLDRDGTINIERHYLAAPAQLELLPNAAQGLRALQDFSLGLVIVTNQSGIGRGFFDEARLTEIHGRLRWLLKADGVELDGIYFCPHRPDQVCGCRKPAPGLIQQAAREFGFEPGECFVIGDKACDVALGQSVAATTLLVRTGYGAQAAQDPNVQPDYIVDDLVAAANVIKNLLYTPRGPQ